ncbi:hypothetical protein [Sphaerisporangium aureirubrum]|uniref:DUF4157 domain-containing protein n=1 Tax=Sphaerisporangium aureirubrum TaxID=1544736 RepID=A0ABW1NPR6_9ACTN
MRVVWLWAVGAGLLVALTGPPGSPGPSAASSRPAVTAGRPDLWHGARTVRNGGAVVAGRPENGLDLTDIARRAARAARIVARVAGPVRPVILVPATTADAAALAAPASVAGMAALAAPGHVIVEPRAFALLTEAGRDVVLAHELTHVATGAATDARTPKWLIEGFADYIGYLNADIPVRAAAAELATEIRAGRLPVTLPEPDAFITPASGDSGQARVARAYEEAWLACRYIAGRYGEHRLVALYRAAGRDPLDTALTETLGLTRDRFVAAWRAYLRTELS